MDYEGVFWRWFAGVGYVIARKAANSCQLPTRKVPDSIGGGFKNYE